MSFAYKVMIPCALLLTAACAQDDIAQQDESGIVELRNEGTMCLYADSAGIGFGIPEPQEFEEGSTLVAIVQAPQCLSQSCDLDLEADCTVVQDGSTLRIDSYMAWTSVEAESCTFDCVKLTATCESAPLTAGVYKVELGESTTALEIPSLVDSPCN
jgi:hypothetical protein